VNLKAFVASALALGTAVLAAGTRAPAAPVGRAAEPCASSTSTPLRASAALSVGVPAEIAGHLAVAGGAEARTVLTPSFGAGVARHIAADRRFGIAYVQDMRGPDTVVALTPEGTIDLPRPAEATHPAWSPTGDLVWAESGGLRVRSATTGAISRIEPPLASAMAFSPVYQGRERIVTAVVQPRGGVIPEDETLSNLWRYDLRAHTWTQLTRFTAGGDRWSVIRTPISGPRGIEFVRVRGWASRTQRPTFELWRLTGRRAFREERLSGERYLAGYRDGTRLWDLPDPAGTTWRIAQETVGGKLMFIGCGAVAVDPIDVPDPDRAMASGTPPLAAGSGDAYSPSSGVTTSPPPPGPPAHEVAILVGDFSTQSGATSAANQILAAYGSTAPVKVVDSTTSWDALKPGMWGAILWIGYDANPTTAIDSFRVKLPQFAGMSWVVAP